MDTKNSSVILIVFFCILIIIGLLIGVIIIIIPKKTVDLHGDCTSQTECLNGLVCSLSMNKTVCLGGLNQSCSSNTDCVNSLTCTDNICVPLPQMTVTQSVTSVPLLTFGVSKPKQMTPITSLQQLR